MIELSVLVWVGAAFFAYVGFYRGYLREIISLAGIMLGLFALYNFDDLLRGSLLVTLPNDQRFYIQTILFLLIVLFAYQSRADLTPDDERDRRSRDRNDQRDPLQTKVLGAMLGFLNGYLIGGTIWYFLEINRLASGQYPLDPFVIAPVPGSPSQSLLSSLPLFVLTSGGSGDLLSLSVVVLFVIVLIII